MNRKNLMERGAATGDYRAAIYCRLSKDDDLDGESASIANQREDPDDKNHFLVDEETAPIVKRIFDYALAGHGPNYIRRRLEDDKVPCPTWWNRQRGIRSHFTKWEQEDPDNGRFIWDFSVIKDILINPVYKGAIASQKKDYRFKLGTLGERKPEDWIVVDGMHEAIVSPEDFKTVQEKLRSRQRPRDDGSFSLFAGLIKCGECGKALTIRQTNAKHPQNIYSCVTYNKYGKHHCTQHRVEYDELYSQVLNKIREAASAALMNDTAVLDRLTDACQEEERQQTDALARQVMKDVERLAVLERMVLKLYEDMVSGRITEQNFDLLMKKTQSEQTSLTARLDEEKKRLSDQSERAADSRRWMETIREYSDIRELDAETLQRLIREITVHETIGLSAN